MERWNGRIALVTGASSGIGATICVALSKYGIRIIGCSYGKEVERIEQLANSLPPGALTAIKCNLRNESEILNMFKTIREKHGGRIDICINNAGLNKITSVTNFKSEDVKEMFEVNVLAMCICARETIKLMRESNIDNGQIINICSVAGYELPHLQNSAFYSGTKHMVRVLTEGLRRELIELKSHIRVACISPSLTKTEIVHRMYPPENKAEADAFWSSVAALFPEDVADCVITILKTPEHVNINDIILRSIGNVK